jgi:hypothetical protein
MNTEKSDQALNINNNSSQPDNRPEHEKAKEEISARLDAGETITPEDAAGVHEKYAD